MTSAGDEEVAPHVGATYGVEYLAPLRIGITGASGTGKTTLAGALARRLRLPLIEEVAREIPAVRATLGSQTTLEAQAAMWFTQFQREYSLSSYVADRTLLDVVVHAHLCCHSTVDQVTQAMLGALTDTTFGILSDHYDLFVYVPIEFPIEPDGIRDTSTEFQSVFDDATKSYLDRSPVPVIEVRGTLDERIRLILASLGGREGERE